MMLLCELFLLLIFCTLHISFLVSTLIIYITAFFFQASDFGLIGTDISFKILSEAVTFGWDNDRVDTALFPGLCRVSFAGRVF